MLLKDKKQQSETSPSVQNNRKAVESTRRQSVMCLQSTSELSDTSCLRHQLPSRSATSSGLISVTYCAGVCSKDRILCYFQALCDSHKAGLSGSVLQNMHHCSTSTDRPFGFCALHRIRKINTLTVRNCNRFLQIFFLRICPILLKITAG